MKIRYYQPQERETTRNYISGVHKVKWYNCGPPKLQYEEEGFWYDVEIVIQSKEDQYDGEREMR